MKRKSQKHRTLASSWARLLCLGLCFFSIAVGMVGCRDKQEENSSETLRAQAVTEPSTQRPAEPSDTASAGDSTYDALHTYYEQLIEELRAELLQEREDRYISDHEYKQRLEELEQALAAFESATKPDDTPTVAPPDTKPAETEAEPKPEDTAPPEPSATFNYRLENDQVIITAYKGRELIVTVPAEINGYPVVAIDDHAFQNTSVTSVILPGTVTSVGWFAFYGCYGLEIVSVPASVISISYAAFDGCPNLTLICPADSYAARYAVSFGLRHEYV